MKITIEIPQEEIEKQATEAVLEIVKSEVRGKANDWYARENIKNAVKKAWDAKVEAVISDCLKDQEEIRTDVKAAIKAKLTARLTKLMSESEKIP